MPAASTKQLVAGWAHARALLTLGAPADHVLAHSHSLLNGRADTVDAEAADAVVEILAAVEAEHERYDGLPVLPHRPSPDLALAPPNSPLCEDDKPSDPSILLAAGVWASSFLDHHSVKAPALAAWLAVMADVLPDTRGVTQVLWADLTASSRRLPDILVSMSLSGRTDVLILLIEAALRSCLGYDARIRLALRHYAECVVQMPAEAFAETEKTVAKRLADEAEQEQAKAAAAAQDDAAAKKARASATKSRFAALKVAAGAVVGGTALALTGGLAAPLVMAVAGAIGIAGAATAIATTAGVSTTILVTTIFGGVGLGITGSKMAKWTSGITEFGFDPIAGEKSKVDHLAAAVSVSGFLLDDQSSVHVLWSRIDLDLPDVKHFTLRWETDALHDAGEFMHSTAVHLLAGQVGGQFLKLNPLLALAGAPMSVLSATDILDNRLGVLVNRADKAALLLAEELLDRQELGRRPISLVASSAGARLVFTALERIAGTCICNDESIGADAIRKAAQAAAAAATGTGSSADADEAKADKRPATPTAPRTANFKTSGKVCHCVRGIVESVVLMGAPVPLTPGRWRRVRQVVANRLVSVFSSSDVVMRLWFRAANITHGSGSLFDLGSVGAGAYPVSMQDVNELADKLQAELRDDDGDGDGAGAGAGDGDDAATDRGDDQQGQGSGDAEDARYSMDDVNAAMQQVSLLRVDTSNSDDGDAAVNAVPQCETNEQLPPAVAAFHLAAREAMHSSQRMGRRVASVESVDASEVITDHTMYQKRDAVDAILRHIDLASTKPCHPIISAPSDTSSTRTRTSSILSMVPSLRSRSSTAATASTLESHATTGTATTFDSSRSASISTTESQ